MVKNEAKNNSAQAPEKRKESVPVSNLNKSQGSKQPEPSAPVQPSQTKPTKNKPAPMKSAPRNSVRK